MTYAVDETFMRKFSRHKDIGWPKHKNNQAILFLSPQIAMSIPPIYRHLMAMPRTKGFKYYLPVYYDSCYGSEQSWGIKWDEPPRTKRKGFLLAMKWWLHTKWYFDIIIVFCVVTFGLYCCFPDLVGMQVSIESVYKGSMRFESKWNRHQCIGMHTTCSAMSFFLKKKMSFALM